jgi:hypothetical protein
MFRFGVLALLATASAQYPSIGNYDYSGGFEVWILDQADTSAAGGGVLYVANHDGDLVDSFDFNDLTSFAGCSQNKRPHMVTPMSSASGNTHHAIISSVGSGNVQMIDTSSKAIVGCVDFPNKENGSPASLHHVVMGPDDSYFIAFDIGSRIFKVAISTSDDGSLELSIVGTLTLEETPKLGVTKPICGVRSPVTDEYYVTLAGGGVLVVNADDADPKVAYVYSKEEAPGVGCTTDTLDDFSILTGGSSKSGANFLYHFPAPTAPEPYPSPITIPMNDGADIHGSFTCIDPEGASFVWVANRLGGSFTVVALDGYVTHDIELPLVNGVSTLPDVTTWYPRPESPDTAGRFFFASRGTSPLTAITEVKDENRRPGWGVGDITLDCQRLLDFTFVESSTPPPASARRLLDHPGAELVIPSDPHGISLIRRGGVSPFADCCSAVERRLLFGGSNCRPC